MGAERRAAARLGALVFAAVALVGQLAVGMRASTASAITGDEPFYLLTTQSLASDGDLDVRDEYAREEYREFWRAEVPLWQQMAPLPDGRLLSPHEPGLSVLVLPAYELAGLRGVQRFLVLVWAAAMACAALAARRSGAPPWAAAAGALAAGAGAPGVVYASQVYPEGVAALVVAVGLLLVTSTRARPVTAGLLLVALPWFGTRYAAFALVLGSVLAARYRRDRRALVVLGTVIVVGASTYVWWHLRTFDAVTAYGANAVFAGQSTADIVGRNVGWAGRSYRLYGLFLDERFGLLRWLPVAALAAFGVCRRTRAAAGLVAAGVLVGTFLSVTMMGWWFPARMLVAGFPGLAVLVAHGATRMPRVAAVLGGWSAAIAIALVWSARTGGVRLAVDPFELGGPLAPVWLFPDFRRFGTAEIAVSVGWGAAFVVALALVRRGHAVRPLAVGIDRLRTIQTAASGPPRGEM